MDSRFGSEGALYVIALITGRVFGVGVLVSAFLLGFRHGIDWDHIAAITDITGSQEDRRDSLIFGTLYALGHGLVVLAIGLVALVLGENLPAGVDATMGRIVGVTLIALGIYVIVSLIRHGREFRMRSRWMLVFSGGRRLYRSFRERRHAATSVDARDADHSLEPVHAHVGTEGDVSEEGEIPIPDWHHGHHGRPGHHHHKHPETDPFMNYAKGTSFLVGMVHGIGGETPTQVLIFLTVAGIGGKWAGVAVLVTFLVGLLSSNTVITLSTAFGFLRASSNWVLYATVATLTAGFSLVIGTIFLIGKETLLPALFGG